MMRGVFLAGALAVGGVSSPSNSIRVDPEAVTAIHSTDAVRGALGTHRRRLASCLWASELLPDAQSCGSIAAISETEYRVIRGR